jgi:hypothetical protein
MMPDIRRHFDARAVYNVNEGEVNRPTHLLSANDGT